ncbi:MAG: AAA family ATPase [Burkholderiaceae bacterium]|nr:AAA family ATPase [Roseateles sp.]MBV8468687.1 AAA family ATPase [Burkholderiaceae bacterium]
MYLQHFGLTEFPFGITPDTGFYFSAHDSQAALNTLLVAVQSGEGFIKITGEVGTGKTMLCRKLMTSLGDEYQIAYVPNPYLQPMALLLELAAELGVASEPLSEGNTLQQHRLVKALTQRLLQLSIEGKRVLVCLDEAQAMPIESLEALRLLTNLETEKRKLVQVVIFGQPELDEKLAHPSIRQLRQRITFDYCIGPMRDGEVDYYLHHRLMAAGHRGGALFSGAARRLLKRRTRGYPRLVNIVAHKALMCAYGRGRTSVDYWDVRAAVGDTRSLNAGLPWKTGLAWGLLLSGGVGLMAYAIARSL